MNAPIQLALAPSLPAIPLRDAEAATIMDTVAQAYALPVVMLSSDRKTSRLTEARQVAMWLIRAHTDLGSSVTAELFDKDPSSVHYAAKNVERQRRADPAFRAFTSALTGAVLARLGKGGA